MNLNVQECIQLMITFRLTTHIKKNWMNVKNGKVKNIFSIIDESLEKFIYEIEMDRKCTALWRPPDHKFFPKYILCKKLQLSNIEKLNE